MESFSCGNPNQSGLPYSFQTQFCLKSSVYWMQEYPLSHIENGPQEDLVEQNLLIAEGL